MSLWLEHVDGGRVTYHVARGLRTRSLEAGDEGPTVIMLHGTWGHAESYIRNVVPLARRGYRVYSIDMIGHGFTDTPAGCEYDIDDFVEHLWGFLDAVGADQAHVVGESLGGWVALRAALTDPSRILSVVDVVGGGLRPVDPTPHERAGWDVLEQRSRQILDEPTFDHWRRRMEWLVHDPTSMPDELVSVRAAINADPAARVRSADVFSSVVRMLREEKPGTLAKDAISRIAVPVYYLWTDHNPTTPASVAEAAHQITADSEFHVMTGCAHWPQYERPDRFNDLVHTYLAAHG